MVCAFYFFYQSTKHSTCHIHDSFVLAFVLTDFLNWDGKLKIVSSPNFPNPYPKNMYLIWNFRAPKYFLVKTRVTNFDLQYNSDFVHIGQGNSDFTDDFDEWTHLTGSLRDIWDEREFTFNGSFISVIFTSDGDTTHTGFRIEFSGEKSEESTTQIQKDQTTQSRTSNITTTTSAEMRTGILIMQLSLYL